ncbi:MAG: sulfur carrier protein ThiS [Chitinophagales bacterium]|jgi:sulfur carrier protein|nr:sulfur carrier protein ThiS [Chitinophagaceae bacterium]MBP9882411.1 sulfur carrier protein ThiS [Chitinophagales bacterium]
MKVKVNSDWMELTDQHLLVAILEKLSLTGKTGIAVAVNAIVVPRKEWPLFKLHEHDEVIIIEAAQGG